jgi:hypothetical protein
MAKTLGVKLNLAWGLNRLRLEHDKWAKEIVEVLLTYEPFRELNIARVYKDFAEYSGYEILTSNHALIEEGKVMGHCVGTYSGEVDRGSCGIFRVHGCTLDLRFSVRYFSEDKRDVLYMNQYQDFGNSRPAEKAYTDVQNMLTKFNADVVDDLYRKALKLPEIEFKGKEEWVNDLNPF